MSGDIDLKQLNAQVTGQPWQPDFNLTHPVSHARDPDTAKQAEAKVTNSGARKSNNQRVAWLVARYPGSTASELNDFALIHRETSFWGLSADARLIEIRRRLSDMNGIHVRRGTKDEARMGLLKNKESVWYPR